MIWRRIPVLPSLLVLLAVGVMIRLGFWQLERMHEKEALLKRYAQAQRQTAKVAWPDSADQVPERLYRRASLDCRKVLSQRTMSGRRGDGAQGLALVVTCELVDPAASIEDDAFRNADIVLGWTRAPRQAEWRGGEVSGTIAPGPRLIADPPLAGLVANAMPDPSEIPNNHLSYAVQWFLFAATALVIYVLALRKRLRENPPCAGEGDRRA